jgi:hypothetical protein
MAQQFRRGRPVFLDLAIACTAVGIAGPRSFLYAGLAFLVVWICSRYVVPLLR